MKSVFYIALISLMFAQAPDGGLQTTAGPLPRERWQRALLPPAGQAHAEQCVVLDAEVFAAAAPGLRDVRLLQGARELPYALAESHDDRETGSAMPVDDRSVFDAVGVAAFGAPEGNERKAAMVLPAHVPVERITLLGSLRETVRVVVRALPGAANDGDAEVVELQAAAGRMSLPVTLGANLQRLAAVEVEVTPGAATLTGVTFEMRRRELCYQPITTEPVRMVYGDPEANLIHYDYALHYRPTATPVLAQFGPREMNPAYEPPVVEQGYGLTLKQRLGIAIGLCAGMIAVTFGALARMLRRRR